MPLLREALHQQLERGVLHLSRREEHGRSSPRDSQRNEGSHYPVGADAKAVSEWKPEKAIDMALPNFSDLTKGQWAMIAAGAGLVTWGAVDIYKQRRKRLAREARQEWEQTLLAARRSQALRGTLASGRAPVRSLETWSPKTVRDQTPEERCLAKYRSQGMTERQAFFACYREGHASGAYQAKKKRTKTSKRKSKKSVLDRILASAYQAASTPRRRRRSRRKLWIDRRVKRPGTFRRMLERAGIVARKERIPLWVKKMGCRTPLEAYRKIFHRTPTPKAARLFQRRACLARTFEDLPVSSGRHVVRKPKVKKIGVRKIKAGVRAIGVRKTARRAVARKRAA